MRKTHRDVGVQVLGFRAGIEPDAQSTRVVTGGAVDLGMACMIGCAAARGRVVAVRAFGGRTVCAVALGAFPSLVR